jgi:ribose 1,5-bisphosphokinase PhnN
MIKPNAIVLSGPSGGGKSTILAKAMKDYPDSFAFSVSRLIINFINYSIFYLRHNKKTAER